MVFVKNQVQQIGGTEYEYYYLYESYYHPGMKNPTNFKVGKVGDDISSLVSNLEDKASDKDIDLDQSDIDHFKIQLNTVEAKAKEEGIEEDELGEFYDEAFSGELGEEDDSEEDSKSSEKSYGGIGGGRRKKLDRIEDFDRLKTLDRSDIQGREDIERFIEDMSVPGVASARGSNIDLQDLLDRLDNMYGDLPNDEARNAYVNDNKLYKTLRSTRRHFNKLIDKEKNFAEMPSAVEAGPAKYPTGKRDKKRKSLRKQKEKVEEKVDRLYGRLKGARQRALQSIGSSVGEQNEKKREEAREKMLDALEVGEMVKFSTPGTKVGRVKRLNKKSVTLEYYGVERTGRIGSGETEEKIMTYRQDLPNNYITRIEAQLGDEALKEITEEDFDILLEMDDSEIPETVDLDFLENLRDSDDEEEESDPEDSVVLKKKSEDGEIKEYDVPESKAEDRADALIDAPHGTIEKIWIDGEVYYEKDESELSDSGSEVNEVYEDYYELVKMSPGDIGDRMDNMDCVHKASGDDAVEHLKRNKFIQEVNKSEWDSKKVPEEFANPNAESRKVVDQAVRTVSFGKRHLGQLENEEIIRMEDGCFNPRVEGLKNWAIDPLQISGFSVDEDRSEESEMNDSSVKYDVDRSRSQNRLTSMSDSAVGQAEVPDVDSSQGFGKDVFKSQFGNVDTEVYVDHEEAKILENFNQVTSHVRELGISDKPNERFVAIYLNSGNEHLGTQVVAMGDQGSVSFDHKSIIRTASMVNASAVIVAHNHPSGNESPSDNDIKAIRDLKHDLKDVNIQLLDSVVIGDSSISSMRRNTSIW